MPINSGYEPNIELINTINDELAVLMSQYDLSYNAYIEQSQMSTNDVGVLYKTYMTALDIYNNQLGNYSNTDRDQVLSESKTRMETAETTYNTSVANRTRILAELKTLYSNILAKKTKINTIINKILPSRDVNNAKAKTTIDNIRKKLEELDIKNAELGNFTDEERKAIKLSEAELEGSYSASIIKTESKFSIYILYLLLLIFVAVCLFYIYIVPESGNLDMFMLALGIIVIGYYLYDYFTKKMRMK